MMSSPRIDRRIGIAIVALAIVILPWVLPAYGSFELTYVGASAIAILGLVILTGLSGQISLGHGAFLAVGGYTVAILGQHAGVPYWLSICAAGVICGLLGLAIGLVASRLEGVYLALSTFALAVATPSILKHFKGLTGGSGGITLPTIAAPGALHAGLSPEQWLYYLTWAIAGLLFFVASSLLRGRIGRSLRALRDNEVAAVSFGVSPSYYKTLAFGWSAAYAGIAGALVAVATAFVSPDSYGFAVSLALVTGAVLGGLDSLWGALIGAVIIEFLPLWAQKISSAAPSIVYGLALIVVMLFAPGGIAGFFRRVVVDLRRRLPTHSRRPL
jgi:branched-chain amino acid transport system permease protein